MSVPDKMIIEVTMQEQNWAFGEILGRPARASALRELLPME